jgi:hypothetical protein
MLIPGYRIIDITDKNFDDYDLFCQKSNAKEKGYLNKVNWFKKRYKEGLRIRLLMIDEGKRGYRSRGFIEYMPGEYAWRGVDAKGWMVIHCIWVVGKNKKYGFGSKLIKACIKDAKAMNGVAVVASRKNWLPGEKIFIKQGFKKVDEFGPFGLHVLKLKRSAKNPRFYRIPEKKKRSYGKGLTVFASDQCPYIHNTVQGLKQLAQKTKLSIRIKHLSSYKDIKEHCVHPYGVFCVLLNGSIVSYYPGGSVSETEQAIAALKK